MIRSTKDFDMMLKINWTQVRGLKEHLARQGFFDTTELLIMTLYKSNVDPIKMRIPFSQLQNYIFEVQGNPSLTGVFVFDAKNKPLWAARVAEREEALEAVPSSGHSNIVTDYKDMSPEQRQVWIDIMLSAVQSYVDKETT